MKKIISILLLSAILLAQPINIFANDYSLYDKIKCLVDDRDDFENLDLSASIKRIDAVKIIYSIINPSPTNTEINYFTDISESDVNIHYINNAAKIGLVNGMGDGTFSPDENLTYEQLYKIIVCLLGYKPKAETMGNYPNGFIMTASSLGITHKSVKTKDNVPTKDFYETLYKSLDVPLMKLKDTSENATYVIYDGKNGIPYKTLKTEYLKE